MITLAIIGMIILSCWGASIPERLRAEKQENLLKRIIEILEENQNDKSN